MINLQVLNGVQLWKYVSYVILFNHLVVVLDGFLTKKIQWIALLNLKVTQQGWFKCCKLHVSSSQKKAKKCSEEKSTVNQLAKETRAQTEQQLKVLNRHVPTKPFSILVVQRQIPRRPRQENPFGTAGSPSEIEPGPAGMLALASAREWFDDHPGLRLMLVVYVDAYKLPHPERTIMTGWAALRDQPVRSHPLLRLRGERRGGPIP